MVKSSQSHAVKSLNVSGGRKRFVFKTLSQRLEEVNFNVFRSLDPIKSKPSGGTSFFRDCLVEWRELNTAADFISFYEIMFPKIQTLPLVILHKELILTELLSRLSMSARLSLEPILRLIAALSKDLSKDYLPFLPRVVKSLSHLLESGADGEPELIEEIFISWSFIVMNLRRYMQRNLVQILKFTLRLRYYHKDYIQKFVAQTISFLLRNASIEQLERGIGFVMREVLKKPTVTRKFGVITLLKNTMQGTPLVFHSKAEKVFHLLLNTSMFAMADKFSQGFDTIHEVLATAFVRMCEDFRSNELNSIWFWFYGEITNWMNDGCLLHLSRLLSLLVSTIQVDKWRNDFNHQKLFELVQLLIEKYMLPPNIVVTNHMSNVIDKVLKLMLCVLDGFHSAENMVAISDIALQWAPVFNLKCKSYSLLSFIEEILLRDTCILNSFRIYIVSVLIDSIESSKEEVICLTLAFRERMKVKSFKLLEGVATERISRLCYFLQDATRGMLRLINDIVCGDQSSIQIHETELALLWGIINCYSYLSDIEEKYSLLLDMVDGLDELLIVANDKEKIAGHTVHVWKSLFGAALSCYGCLISDQNLVREVTTKFMRLAKRYKSSLPVLVSVADFLDSTDKPILQDKTGHKLFHPDLTAEKVNDAVQIFAENLSHSNKDIRVSTLRILCHYDYSRPDSCTEWEPDGMQTEINFPEKCAIDIQSSDVLQYLHSIEATTLDISSCRKVTLLISKIHTALISARMSEADVIIVFNGIIGIFHNRFSYLWDPASDCLLVLLSKHVGVVWEMFVYLIEQYQLRFLTALDEQYIMNDKPPHQTNGLVARFNQFVFRSYDSTPCQTVLCLLLQSLKKIPDIIMPRSQNIVQLFLMFLGYNDSNLLSVGTFNSHSCKGKEWKSVLKDWLNLLKVMRNLKSSYQSEFLKEVLQSRLLDDNDADIQMEVLDCLLIWKDDFLLPYGGHLKNLIDSKSLREELATWSISKESNLIEECHRSHLLPLVIRILMPKIRTPKILTSQKHARLNYRKAVLGFIAQIDVNELSLFFELLIGQFSSKMQEDSSNIIWSSTQYFGDNSKMLSFLNGYTMDNILSSSWKKRLSFMHVIEDLLGVFDEQRVVPFLDLLLGLVVRVLRNCTQSLQSDISDLLSIHDHNYTVKKQFKDLRSLCLKIISFVLNKYEDHDFGSGFFDLFIMSLKPLIQCFKQEASSSQKPSALFSCFIAMSRSEKLVTILYQEKNIFSEIFSILTVSTASDAMVLGVFEFIENLLNLDTELDIDDHVVKRILLVNLESLICNLHTHILNKATRRKSLIFWGDSELRIIRRLSKYTKDNVLVKKFVEILLQILTLRSENSDTSIEILRVLQDVVPILGCEITGKVLNVVCPVLLSAGIDMRLSVCSLLGSLSQNDSAILSLAKFISELNAPSSVEIGELDYDIVLTAYGQTNTKFFCAFEPDHALVILSQFVYDMSSDEIILRQSAHRSLLAFVEFSALVLDRELGSDHEISKQSVTCVINSWSGIHISRIINTFLLKHMGAAMNKGSFAHKEWMELFREMVLKLSGLSGFISFQALCSIDAEKDFFYNILHLQKHRRSRALSFFKSVNDLGTLPEVITCKVFVPLFWNMMLDIEDGKEDFVRSFCVEALASISGCMKWTSYYALVIKCLKEITLKPNKHKFLLRLVCCILDNFHFSSNSFHEKVQGALRVDSSIERDGSSELLLCENTEYVKAQNCLQKTVLPKIQKLITSDSEKVNVRANLALLKLLKLLPGDILDSHLTTIIQHISNFLKYRLESVRDDARSALAACLKELGLEYLQLVVSILQATLKRGYELHVLGYTINFILSTILHTGCGKLDYCLEDLLSVVENDLFGDVSEEKEVNMIASKMKETRKAKSFDTLKLISQNITFKSHALYLLSPFTARINKQLTPKMKLKVQTAFRYIASGIEGNSSVSLTDFFIFLYGLINEGVSNESRLAEKFVTNSRSDDICEKSVSFSSIIGVEPQCLHLVTVFALGLLNNRLKNLKLYSKNQDMLSMLDPFIKLLGNCLHSKFEDIVSAATKCLAPLIRMPLPALKSQANTIKAALFDIAQSSTNTNSALFQSSLKLLTVLLRSSKVTLSIDQLHLLIQFPLFIELDKNPSFVALSLLKAIINRKLVVPEIYDLAARVAELMVTSQVEPIRKKCSQILLQFLLDYKLSAKRLQQHLDYLIVNLRYEHSTGREAVLEILNAIIVKFPKNIVDEQSQTFFVHFVVSLANDHDNKIRSMIGVALKHLIGRISQHSLQSVLEYCLSWYLGSKQELWSAAAQVLGLLIEVMEKGFQMYIMAVMPMIKNILQCSMTVFEDRQPDLSKDAMVPLWKEAYYSLILWEKIVHQFSELCFQKEIEDIWESIIKLLLHPHMWIRSISNRLVAFYFASVAKSGLTSVENSSVEIYFLMRPSRLFLIAASVCCHLTVDDDATSCDEKHSHVYENIVFAISRLYSFIEKFESFDAHAFWSTLELQDRKSFLAAFQLLDSRKGSDIFTSLVSSEYGSDDDAFGPYFLVSYLIKRMGKLSLHKEGIQMRIVLNSFKKIILEVGKGGCEHFAKEMLLPLYKICEGYSGNVISDDMKVLAREVCEEMQRSVGGQKYVELYNEIRKSMSARREKRKQVEKVMAVTDPTRDAKRKLRIAEKHRVHKKRKINNFKLQRWMH